MNYIIYALITLLCFGLTNFFLTVAGSKGINSFFGVFVALSVGFVVATMFLILTKTKIELYPGTNYALLAGISLGLGMLAIKFALSVKGTNPGVATAIANGNALIVAILSYFFLNKTLNVRQAGGIGLIILGIAALSLL